MAIYTVNIEVAGQGSAVSVGDGSTLATLAVSAGRGPKGDGWTGVSYSTVTGRFTFTSNDGLGYVSDDITVGLDADTLDGQDGSFYTGYTDTAIANILDAAPATLDTLNELAAALGDDPNFATTVTNSIATKLPLAGGTMTGSINFAAGQTFDGRDVSADGAKLDGIEVGADVTDTLNVTAAGALMDSEVTNLAQVKAFDSADYATAAELNRVDQLAGRNLIINGSGRVNQRAYVNGTSVNTPTFTLDRWAIRGTGPASLTFTGDSHGRVMTAPVPSSAYMLQIIEGANVVGGTYVLSFVGTATCKVNGTIRVSGDTFSLPANTNVNVQFENGTFTDVQLELGTVPTPFEYVDFGIERVRCMRYFEATKIITATATYGGGGGAVLNSARWSVKKRTTPALSFTVPEGTGFSVATMGSDGFYQNALHSLVREATISGDAEL